MTCSFQLVLQSTNYLTFIHQQPITKHSTRQQANHRSAKTRPANHMSDLAISINACQPITDQLNTTAVNHKPIPTISFLTVFSSVHCGFSGFTVLYFNNQRAVNTTPNNHKPTCIWYSIQTDLLTPSSC